MIGEDLTAINRDGLRERKPKEKDGDALGQDKDVPSDSDSIPTEPVKSDKAYGRTPDGSGEPDFLAICCKSNFRNLSFATM